MTSLGGRRVAVVGPVPPIRGGIAHHTDRVAEALRLAGVDVRIWTWASQYPKLLYRREQLDPSAVPTPGAKQSLSWWDPRSWTRTSRDVNRFQPDWLFVPWVTPFHARPTRTLITRVEAPTVVHVHNAEPHEWFPFTKTLTKHGLERAARIIAHSGAIVDDLRRQGIDLPSVVTPIPPTLAVERSALPPVPPLRLLFLGFVRRYKGADLAVEALRHCPTDVALTIAGEFWVDIHELRRNIESAGVADRVALIDGYLSEEEVSHLIADHHAIIAPYRSATQSAVVPLAFAGGRPVVATRVGGLVEAVTDGVNGVLCDPEPWSIARAIDRLRVSLHELADGASHGTGDWSGYVEAAFAPLSPTDPSDP